MSNIAIDTASIQASGSIGMLYTFNQEKALTFTELLMAVSVERAISMEAVSVTKMASMTAKTSQLSGYTACAAAINGNITDLGSLGDVYFTLPDEYVPEKGHDYSDRKKVSVADFLEYELGVTTLDTDAERGISGSKISTRSTSLTTTDYLAAYGKLKTRMEELNTNAQEDLIDIQTYVSRRDTAYKLATNAVKTTLAGMTNTAGNLN